MKHKVEVILFGDAKIAFEKLNSIIEEKRSTDRIYDNELMLMNSIKKKMNLIRLNPFYGDNIPKRLIPLKYGVDNLWRVELPGYWRMIYAIQGNTVEIRCFILDIFSHKEYNKKFGYKKK